MLNIIVEMQLTAAASRTDDDVDFEVQYHVDSAKCPVLFTAAHLNVFHAATHAPAALSQPN